MTSQAPQQRGKTGSSVPRIKSPSAASKGRPSPQESPPGGAPSLSARIADRLKRANLLHAKGRLAEADTVYRSVLLLDPRHRVALAALGNIASQRSRSDGASAQKTKAPPVTPRARPSPQKPPAGAHSVSAKIADRLKRANSLRAKGRLAEADTVYRSVLALDPKHGVALAALGNIASQRSQFDDALKYFSAASAADPKNSKLPMAIGDVLRRASRLVEARQTYEKIVAADPSNVRAIVCLGIIARQNHDNAAAIAEFERALTIDPTAKIARDLLRQLRSENISRDNTRGEFLKLLEADPHNAKALAGLARLARRAGEHKEACKYFALAWRSEPTNVQLRCEYADALRELGRMDDAAAVYKGAESAKALTGLGIIAQARGNTDAAVRFFKAASDPELQADDEHVAGLAARIEEGNLMLRRLFPALAAEAALPTGSDYNRAALVVAPCRVAKSLMLTFGGNTPQVMLPSEITTLKNMHVIAIRDPHRCFSLCGIPGLGKTYEDCLENIRRLITEFAATHVYCAGVSAGAYSALRYGLDLGGDGVLAFSAPTTLDLADDNNAPLSRYPQLTALYRKLPGIPLDLAKLYRSTVPRPQAILLYSPSDKRDSWLASRMRGIEGVELNVAPGEAGHRVFPWLKSQRRIASYIDRLLALRPVSQPETDQP